MHTQLPSATANVFFDANSFTAGSQVVTLDVVADCNNMDWSGVSFFPTISGNGNDMNIYGSLTLSPDMTANFSDVEFEGTGTGNTITTNGTSLGASSVTRFNGIGGEWLLQDVFTTNSIYMVAGTLTTNSNTVNAGTFFQLSGSSTKALNLGASVITCDRWWILGTNQTIDAGTSKIITSIFYSDGAGDGPFTYYDVEFSSGGRLRDNATFNEITIVAGQALTLQAGDVFTLNNLIAAGNKHSRIIIKSSTPGTESTLNKASGAIIVDFVELADVYGTGGATFTANNATGNGNTNGWTINPEAGQDYFWVGNGGDWADFANHWATTSGGSTMHTDYPGKNDNVFFDTNSFTTPGQTVTLDVIARCRDMDWTGVTNAPYFYGAFSVQLEVYGSLTFSPGVEKAVWNVSLNGAGNHTFTASTLGTLLNLSVKATGSYTLQDSLRAQGFSITKGTFNTNGQPVSTSVDVTVVGSADGTTVDFGSSNIYARKINLANYTNQPVINPGTSNVYLTGGITVQSNTVSNFQFNNVFVSGTATLEGSNTFANLTLEPGASVTFEEGETTTINNNLSLSGTSALPITLGSTVPGTAATLAKASGTVNGTYLILQDITATGGATFNAAQSIDNGNNTGWNITVITGQDYYWVGDGGNWSDFATHWATTSGGSTMHTAVPGVLDNVIFDANSFSVAGEFVVIDDSQANFNDFDASAVSNGFTLSGLGKELNIYGSVLKPATVNMSVGTITLLSDEAETLDFNNGPGNNTTLNFSAGGTWTLASDLNVNEIQFNSGTLNTAGFAVTVFFQYRFYTTSPKVLNLGTSTLEAGILQASGASGITVNGPNSELIIHSTFSLPDVATNSISLNNITFDKNSVNTPRIYSDLTVNKFTITAGSDLVPSGIITVVANEFVLAGTSSAPIRIYPQVVTSSITFSQASGVVDGYYLELEEVTATGGATFNAYNSVDNGGVIGWVFHRSAQTITFDPLPDKTVGDSDFIISATASSGLPVTFTLLSGPATMAGDTVLLTGSAGTVSIKAEQAGDVNYDPAPSVTQTFAVLPASQSITFAALADKTYGDAPFDLTATASSGLAVSYTVVSGPVSISGSTVTITGAGTAEIMASQAGDANYQAAAPVSQRFTIAKAGQTITFAALADKTYGDAPFDLTATAGSGLAVSYTVVSGPVSISGSTVTITGAGTAEIMASQAGDANYQAAAPVSQRFTIAKAGQSITFAALPDVDLDQTTLVSLSATASSGLAVSYTVEGPATLNDTTLTLTAPGTVTVTASQAGNDNYMAANAVEQSFTVTGIVSGLAEANLYNISVYPQPALTLLTLTQPAGSFNRLAVYDLNGRLQLSGPITGRETRMDVSGLERGVYLLRLSGQEKSLALKIIVGN